MGTVFYLGQAMPSGDDVALAAIGGNAHRGGCAFTTTTLERGAPGPRLNRRPRKGSAREGLCRTYWRPRLRLRAPRRAATAGGCAGSHPGVFCFVGARGSTTAPSTGSACASGWPAPRAARRRAATTRSAAAMIDDGAQELARAPGAARCAPCRRPGRVAFLIGTSTRLPAAARAAPSPRGVAIASALLLLALRRIGAPTRRAAPARARRRTAASARARRG